MIEIAPRPKAEAKKSVQYFLYISVALLIITIISYFIVGYLYNKRSDELEVLRNQLAMQDVEEINDLKTNLTNRKMKIDDFNILVSSRKSSIDFFEFVEKNTHPNVRWGDVELYFPDKILKLRGEAESFSILTQQILVFKNSEKVKEVELENVQISEGGTKRINFSLDFLLREKAFFK